MISKQHRFHGHSSLSFVYHRGTTVRNQLMSLKFARNSRRTSYRAAVIVSRKVQKSAVVRNRIRRRIYEVIRSFELAITDPYDIALTVFSDQLAELPASDLHNLIAELFVRAGIVHSRESKAHLNGRGIVKTNKKV